MATVRRKIVIINDVDAIVLLRKENKNSNFHKFFQVSTNPDELLNQRHLPVEVKNDN